MRDMSLFVVLLALAVIAWRKPWTGGGGLALLGATHPQAYGGEWAARLPAYKAPFVVTCLAAALEFRRRRQWPNLPFDWRLVVLGVLFANFVITASYAVLPDTARGPFTVPRYNLRMAGSGKWPSEFFTVAPTSALKTYAHIQ